MTENKNEFSISMNLDIGQVQIDVETITQFYFIEDIFSFCVTGKMIFMDRRGLFEFGPLTGNERINIIYGENEDKNWTFNIFKISKIQQDAVSDNTIQKIELSFTDVMFIPLNFLQYSRSWKDQKIDTIIDDISTNFLGIDEWGKKETINETLDYFLMPYWNVNRSLNWLFKKSTGLESGNPGFLFYNNSQGANLITLDTLLKNEKLLSIGEGDDGVYVINDYNLFLYNKILDWSISGIDTMGLKRLSGATMLGYDNITKKFLTKETTYKEILKKHTVLGKASLFPDYSESRMRFELTSKDTENELNTSYNNEWIKLYDKQHTMSIVVKGHENRFCGEMIEIQFPTAEIITQQYNQNLSGNYLIKSITHNFSGYNTPSYLQKMVLIKNGYDQSDALLLEKSVLTNLAT